MQPHALSLEGPWREQGPKSAMEAVRCPCAGKRWEYTTLKGTYEKAVASKRRRTALGSQGELPRRPFVPAGESLQAQGCARRSAYMHTADFGFDCIRGDIVLKYNRISHLGLYCRTRTPPRDRHYTHSTPRPVSSPCPRAPQPTRAPSPPRCPAPSPRACAPWSGCLYPGTTPGGASGEPRLTSTANSRTNAGKDEVLQVMSDMTIAT